MRYVMKESYYEDIRLFKYFSTFCWYTLLLLGLIILPAVMGEFFQSQLTMIFIYSVAALGLMLLTGYNGQFSLGHAAFFAIGSYSTAILTSKGIPFFLSLPLSGLIAGLIGILVAIPALRLTGLYLAIATLGFAYIVEEILARWESLTKGNMGMYLDPPSIGSFAFETETSFYYLALAVLVISILWVANILRSPSGRAMVSIRDSEVAAQSIGINLLKFKSYAFFISAFLTGMAGCLSAHKLNYINPENFSIMESITFLIMIIIGGLGSIHGAVFGAIFFLALPSVIMITKDYLPQTIAHQTGLEPAVMGVIIILFVLFEPSGIYGLWQKIKYFFENFPLFKKDTFKRVRSYYKAEKH
jgi:branched-chain amino acid transport system permease protein